MKILVINSGSSSLKFDLVQVGASEDGSVPADKASVSTLARGMVDRIGEGATLELSAQDPALSIASHEVDAPTHVEAVALALQALKSSSIDAVGHRVVHGGDRFVTPTLIDETVLKSIEELCELAPLHNPAALDGIRAARKALGAKMPMVAVFDTAFHNTLPDYAYNYAIPHALAQKHRVRRYGFHGIAHQYMMEQYADAAGKTASDVNIITLQLGNGCSAAAIQGGKSVDTSMGFTPLEGLVMGTRSGDIDASVISYLAEKEGVKAETVESWLNKRSGLLGLSGKTNDMRSLLQARDEGDEHARLAIAAFCYRVRKYIGAYLAALGGVEAIVFGGGIGENAAQVRAQILQDLDRLHIHLDPNRNNPPKGKAAMISTDHSGVAVYVIPVDEAKVIARDTARLVA